MAHLLSTLPPIITLTTDFGPSSPYVAEMKGVIYSLNPAACVVDLTHAIPPQDIFQGAQALARVGPKFPVGTIHVAVIDPGVGTSREIVYAAIADRFYICPDNGLLGRLASEHSPSKIRAITNSAWFREPVSSTFHGRDIMAPAAARLSLGHDPDDLGPSRERLQSIEWTGAAKLADNRIEGQIESVDSFGNLITNISREMLAHAPRDETVSVVCDEHATNGIYTTYAEQPPMTLIALIGSSDQLEMAIVDESAAVMLGVGVGTPVVVSW